MATRMTASRKRMEHFVHRFADEGRGVVDDGEAHALWESVFPIRACGP